MIARLIWNGDRAKKELRDKLARGLMEAAVLIQSEHMKNLGVPNPPPHTNSSGPGEFPRKRTGFLQAHVLIVPSTLAAVARDLAVKIGIATNADYGVILQLRGWKGLRDTVAALKDRLKNVIVKVK